MTFASSTLAPGDYVVGNLVAFSLASSASASLYGVADNVALAGQTVSAVTGITSASLGALSSGGLAAVSALTGTTNITVNSEALGAGSAVTGTVAGSVLTGLSSLGTASAGITNWFITKASTNVASTTIATATNIPVAQMSLVVSVGTAAGSVISAVRAGSIITGTTAATALSAAGYSAGSFVGTSGSFGAVTNVGLAALGGTTINAMTTSVPSFNYLGASSVLTGGSFYAPFQGGVMGTGGVPAAITLTTGAANALTTYGSTAAAQPWFAMIGL
jgi:hypothetical protein